MKKFGILACVVLVLAILLIQAQDNAPPIISFDNVNKDFGKVTEGQVLKHMFRFTNKGSTTLEILKVESS